MSVDDPIDLLSRALDQTGSVIARVRPEQASLPTPCTSWNVRDLVNHVVHDAQQFRAMAAGGRYEKGEDDVIGDDWDGAYRRAAGELLAEWRREGALDRVLRLPIGEVPATWSIGQHIADMVVHGWDVAKATGQSTDFDPEVGAFALAWGRENLRPEFRGDEASGKVFGPEVAVPDEAPVHDRLAGVFGRDPRWSPVQATEPP
jgi:uncharacterized protein (TIGR03086 family)